MPLPPQYYSDYLHNLPLVVTTLDLVASYCSSPILHIAPNSDISTILTYSDNELPLLLYDARGGSYPPAIIR